MSRRGGMGSHQSPRSDTTTWLTPRPILDALGPFDLDPCAAPVAAGWHTAATHYVWPESDGLALPWFGRVWLNPPYGGTEMAKFLRRLAAHGRGTGLVFARTDTKAFFAHVFEGADALMFLRGRLWFHDADGRRGRHSGGAPSVLCAYGEEDVERLMASGLDGQLVGLRRPVLLHLALRVDPPTAAPVWAAVVADAVRALGGRASLSSLYERLRDHPRSRANPNWQAKVRQTLGRSGYNRVGRGQYELAL